MTNSSLPAFTAVAPSSNNLYSFKTGRKVGQEPEYFEAFEKQHLKFGLQKEVSTRRIQKVKRGPWSGPSHPFRNWTKQGEYKFIRFPDYKIPSRFISLDDPCYVGSL